MLSSIFIFSFILDHCVSQRLATDIDPNYKFRHIKALIKLSKMARFVPECLIINVQISADPPEDNGFFDIYKGELQGNQVTIKILKAHQKSDMEKFFKVTAILTFRRLWLRILTRPIGMKLSVGGSCHTLMWCHSMEFSVFLTPRECV